MPPEVAINEAVVLAKRYATEDAARLVNGILGRVARERGGGMSGATRRSGGPRSCSSGWRRSATSWSGSPQADDVEAAVDVLAELAELAKEIEAELAKAGKRASARCRQP